jgi:predicted GIY-YIG superfamily endonuclease
MGAREKSASSASEALARAEQLKPWKRDWKNQLVWREPPDLPT